MGLLGKSDRERLSDTFDYIDKLHPPQRQVDLLWDWVYRDGPFETKTVSEALSLKLGLFNRQDTDKQQRRAVRACILARLGAETPDTTLPAHSWASGYIKKTESELKPLILSFLTHQHDPSALPSMPLVGLGPTNYGVNAKTLLDRKQNLSAPKPKVGGPPPPPKPGDGATHKNKKDFFETVSRVNVILSGHGSVEWDSSINGWPKTTLGKQQIIRFYCPCFWPLANDVGQFVDNRRFPTHDSELGPGGQIDDYTLHPKDKLVLLNRGGSSGDREFITVNSKTRLSFYLAKPEFAAATFHWAACRVWFDDKGELWCPTHSKFEAFNSACVLR